MRESKIQGDILHVLAVRGAYTVKIVTASKAGVPDILCCYRGSFIAFEVKGPKGKTSALQDINIKNIKKAGGLAYVVRSVSEVVTVLNIIDTFSSESPSDA